MQTLAEMMQPYRGESHPGVDTSTLTGKLMSGYQGWFRTPTDGAGQGWVHWGQGQEFRPGCCKIDVWPEMTELEADECYPTPFLHRDGRPATVFSSVHKKTVMRHFKWMKDHGLDGAFMQRFFASAKDTLSGKDISTMQVIAHAREAANVHGRAYAIMYDLSGMQEGEQHLLFEDWKRMKEQMTITADPAYLRHRGKPLVAVWGIGFDDDRSYSLDACAEIVDFLKKDGNTVMLGVPTGWREQNKERPYRPFVDRAADVLDGDCVKDPRVHKVIQMADIVSPWTPERAIDPAGVKKLAETIWAKDLAWCKERGLDFLPVCFPGFSWKNMYPQDPFNKVPRLKGQFLWQMYYEAAKLGGGMIYQAMFDEVDEGTAIFQCSDDPPVGASRFVSMEGLPRDEYLWLAGQAAKMLRGERPLVEKRPSRQAI